MNILITGGLGYIGSHIALLAYRNGHSVHILDNLERGNLSFSRFGKLTIGDIRDKGVLSSIFSNEKIDAVVHCAALAYVHESESIPDEYWSVNVDGTRIIKEAAEEAHVEHIVFASSCSIYGETGEHAVTESSSFLPLSTYSKTKVLGEQILSSSKKFSSISLRFFNAAGGAPTEGLGESHEPETHIIPKLLRYAIGVDTQPVKMFIKGIRTFDGYPRRDFVHVIDIARAHVLALEFLQKNKRCPHLAFNIGSGEATSLLTVIKLVEKICNVELLPKLIVAESSPLDPASVHADISRAREVLNWKPMYNLEKIVMDAYEWIKRTRNL